MSNTTQRIFGKLINNSFGKNKGVRKVPFSTGTATRALGTPSEIQKTERVLIDSFEFENNRQFTSVDVVAVGDVYELWVNEERVYNHLCLHKVYRRALVELEAKYRGIEHE